MSYAAFWPEPLSQPPCHNQTHAHFLTPLGDLYVKSRLILS
jgi:hypothetical protein